MGIDYLLIVAMMLVPLADARGSKVRADVRCIVVEDRIEDVLVGTIEADLTPGSEKVRVSCREVAAEGADVGRLEVDHVAVFRFDKGVVWSWRKGDTEYEERALSAKTPQELLRKLGWLGAVKREDTNWRTMRQPRALLTLDEYVESTVGEEGKEDRAVARTVRWAVQRPDSERRGEERAEVRTQMLINRAPGLGGMSRETVFAVFDEGDFVLQKWETENAGPLQAGEKAFEPPAGLRKVVREGSWPPPGFGPV